MHTSIRRIGIMLAIAAVWITGSASAEPRAAREIVHAALARAQAEDKNVLVHFGASWCVWCLRLDALLDGPEFGQLFNDNYVIAHLTIMESKENKALENPGADRMAEDAVGEVRGLPFYMFFNGEGELLATSQILPNGGTIGHPVSPEEIEAFVGLLERTAPRMTSSDRDRIAAYLSKQTF